MRLATIALALLTTLTTPIASAGGGGSGGTPRVPKAPKVIRLLPAQQQPPHQLQAKECQSDAQCTGGKKCSSGYCVMPKPPVVEAITDVKPEPVQAIVPGYTDFVSPLNIDTGAVFVLARTTDHHLQHWYWTADGGWGKHGHHMTIGNATLKTDPVMTFVPATGGVIACAQTTDFKLACWSWLPGEGWGVDGHEQIISSDQSPVQGPPAIMNDPYSHRVYVIAPSENTTMRVWYWEPETGWGVNGHEIGINDTAVSAVIMDSRGTDETSIFNAYYLKDVGALRQLIFQFDANTGKPIVTTTNMNLEGVTWPFAVLHNPFNNYPQVMSLQADGTLHEWEWKPQTRHIVWQDADWGSTQALAAVFGHEPDFGTPEVFVLGKNTSLLITFSSDATGHYWKTIANSKSGFRKLAAVANERNTFTELFAVQNDDTIRHYYGGRFEGWQTHQWHEDSAPFAGHTVAHGIVALALAPTYYRGSAAPAPKFVSFDPTALAASQECPAGQVAVGLDVRSGANIDAVGLICKKPFATEAVSHQGFLAGGSGGGLDSLMCPAGTNGEEGILVGAAGTRGIWNSAEDIALHSLQIKCALLTKNDSLDGIAITGGGLTGPVVGDPGITETSEGLTVTLSKPAPVLWDLPGHTIITRLNVLYGERVIELSFGYRVLDIK